MYRKAETKEIKTQSSNKVRLWRNIWLISILAFIVSIPIMVAFGSLGLIGLYLFVYLLLVQPSRIYGTSMEPTFKDKAFVLIDKFTYRFSPPKRGEAVDYLKDDEERIGRIIGLPGETIQIKHGEVRIDDNVISEPYADWSNWAGNREQQVTLKDDEYLVLYDKRRRDIQVVKRENIIGRFFYRYWPSSEAGFIKY